MPELPLALLEQGEEKSVNPPKNLVKPTFMRYYLTEVVTSLDSDLDLTMMMLGLCIIWVGVLVVERNWVF